MCTQLFNKEPILYPFCLTCYTVQYELSRHRIGYHNSEELDLLSELPGLQPNHENYTECIQNNWTNMTELFASKQRKKIHGS